MFRRHSIHEISSFGAAVRNETELGSDLDPMGQFAPGGRAGPPTFELPSEQLEALAGLKVDLVTKRGLKSWISPQVLRAARFIHAV